jgi:serine phosphatase RsbU (regulator of sigma subunit)
VADSGYFGNYERWPVLWQLEFQVPDLANLLFLVAIAVVLFFRFTRVSREQARTAAELDAAREIQRQLVPAKLPDVPDFRIEAAYFPAEEVGGDFYQALSQPDGATLIVIGDVSGKGLKAAMTGALTIGSLRTLAQEGLGPAELLTRLNRQIYSTQNAGFVTCLAMRIAPDRAVTLANAGHLPPYRSGKEIGLEPGLPLGIVANADYSEAMLTLGPGDTFTLLTDGVVEARNAAGELFGFERTAAISTQAAEAIAAAAREYGQEDDITVLTLNFTAASTPAVGLRA